MGTAIDEENCLVLARGKWLIDGWFVDYNEMGGGGGGGGAGVAVLWL